ncbi:MAG: IS4 family transposase, partial [Chloroflexota bacterium]|nr:IS4 family transposase [Chloroflexota bacterium]
KKLSVTGLGRSINNAVFEKHNIKRADRLIGNPTLNQERGQIYRVLAQWTIGQQRRPVILVDWSDLSADRHYHLLRASLPIGGRALTLYDEVHPTAKLGNPNVQQRFLKTLQTLLPESCQPIIVSDAGFRNPWFRAVQAMGWDFVGRVGGHTMISPHNKADWIRVEPVFSTATTRPKYLGHIDLARNAPLTCHAYLVKKKKQGRVKKTVFGDRCAMKHSEKNAERERTPWLIVTSLGGGAKITKRVMNLYQSRMQIEEGFRDFKNSRWGFGLDEARASASYRYENLLLIGTLATFAIWLIGKLAEMKNRHRRYQANTVKSRNVLSLFYLGCRVLYKRGLDFRETDFKQALRALRQQFEVQCYA